MNALEIMEPRADGRSPVKMAFDLGMRGSPATETQRLLFESWMKGHCWMVCGEWDGSSYKHPDEHAGHVDPGTMHTRQLWATWRDCSALCEQLQGQPQSIINQLELTTRELVDLARFDECASDNEGYDVPKERMKALARIGVVNHVTAGIYSLTKAGQLVLDELENQSKQKASS